jgi:hypothetical protein
MPHSETELLDRLCAIVAEQNSIIQAQAHIITQLQGDNPTAPRIQSVTLTCRELTGNLLEK